MNIPPVKPPIVPSSIQSNSRSPIKAGKEDFEFQRQMRNQILDNIAEIRNKKYSAGSETLDKVLLDFYKMLYDDRNPVQQDKFETAAFLIDFFQTYTKNLSNTIQNTEKTLLDTEANLDKQTQQNYNLQTDIANLKAKVDNLNKKLEFESNRVFQGQDNVAQLHHKSRQLEETFDKNIVQYKEMLAEANKEAELKNLELIDQHNKIRNLESQLKMEKEEHDRSRTDLFNTRALSEQLQGLSKTQAVEIEDLRRTVELLSFEKENLAKKVIQWELTEKHLAAVHADLDTHKEICKRQSKELVDVKSQLNNLKVEFEATKNYQDQNDHYLRNLKFNLQEYESQDGGQYDQLINYVGRAKSNSPNKNSRLDIIDPDEQLDKKTAVGQPLSQYVIRKERKKDIFGVEIPQYSRNVSPTQVAPRKNNMFAGMDKHETWKNLGRYKMSDVNQERDPAGKPSNPTHFMRPDSNENDPNFSPDMDQWQNDQQSVKQLDKELTKFQRAKVFIESDLNRQRTAPNSMGVILLLFCFFLNVFRREKNGIYLKNS